MPRSTVPLVALLFLTSHAVATAQSTSASRGFRREKSIEAKTGRVYSLDWSDSTTLLAGCSGENVEIWDATGDGSWKDTLSEFTRHRTLMHRGSATLSLQVSHGGQWIAAGGLDGQARIWRYVNRPLISSISKLMAADRDHKWLAASNGTSISRWSLSSLASPNPLPPVDAHDSLAVAPDGMVLAGNERTSRIQVVVGDDVRHIHLPYPPNSAATKDMTVAVAPGASSPGRTFLSIGADGALRTWESEAQPKFTSDELKLLQGDVSAIDDTGKFIAVASQTDVRVYELSGSKLDKKTLPSMTIVHPIRALAWSDSARQLAIVDAESKFFIVNIQGPSALPKKIKAIELTAENGEKQTWVVDRVALASNASRIALVNEDEAQIRVYDMSRITGDEFPKTPLFSRYQLRPAKTLSFLGDQGQWLMARTGNGLVAWDLKDQLPDDQRWVNGWNYEKPLTVLTVRPDAETASATLAVRLAAGFDDGELWFTSGFKFTEGTEPKYVVVKAPIVAGPISDIDMSGGTGQPRLVISTNDLILYCRVRNGTIELLEARKLASAANHTTRFVADSRLVVSCAPAQPASFWQIAALEMQQIAATTQMDWMVFAAGGDELYVIDKQHRIKQYTPGPDKAWRPALDLEGHTEQVTAVLSLRGYSSYPGVFAVSASRDRTIRLWERDSTGKARTRLLVPLPKNEVKSLHAGQDGRAVIAELNDGSFAVLDLRQKEPERAVERTLVLESTVADGERHRALAIDDMLIYSNGNETRARTIGARRQLGTDLDYVQKRGYGAQVYSLAWCAPGAANAPPRVAVGTADGFLNLWDFANDQPLAPVPPPKIHNQERSPRYAMVVRGPPPGNRLSSAAFGGPLQSWDVSTGQRMLPDMPLPHQALCLAMRPDNANLLVGCYDGNIYQFLAADMKPGPRIPAGGNVIAMAVRPQEAKLLAAIDMRGYLTLWDLDQTVAGGSLVKQLDTYPTEAPKVRFNALAWNPDGTRLAVADSAGQIHFFSVVDL